jgi:hypothetical protein
MVGAPHKSAQKRDPRWSSGEQLEIISFKNAILMEKSKKKLGNFRACGGHLPPAAPAAGCH